VHAGRNSARASLNLNHTNYQRGQSRLLCPFRVFPGMGQLSVFPAFRVRFDPEGTVSRACLAMQLIDQ